jgi:hypothetical protein
MPDIITKAKVGNYLSTVQLKGEMHANIIQCGGSHSMVGCFRP